MCRSSAILGGSVFGVKGLTYTQQNMAMSHAGDEIGRKFGIPSEFVLAIQEYFGLPFSLSFGHPNIFWHASSPFWPAVWHLACCYFAPSTCTNP